MYIFTLDTKDHSFKGEKTNRSSRVKCVRPPQICTGNQTYFYKCLDTLSKQVSIIKLLTVSWILLAV